MARIPKYPYRVVTTIRMGEQLRSECHNYETLIAAMSYRDIALHKQFTRKVEILCVLDESTPSHPA